MRHLYRFRGLYYFRSRIPSDLQGLFQCTLIKKSLKTKDIKTATSSAKILSNELYRVIKLIRSRILTDEQIDQLVREFFQQLLQKSETYKRDVEISDPANLLAFHDFQMNKLKAYLNAGSERIEGFVDSFLDSKDLPVSKESYKTLRREFVKALIEFYGVEKARIEGDYNNWYDDFRAKLKSPASSAPVANARLLTDIAAEYFKEKSASEAWRTKTEEGNRSMFDLFHEIVRVILKTETVHLHQINRKVCVEFSEILKRIPANMKKFYKNETVADILALPELTKSHPISPKTRGQYLIFVSTLLSWCEDRGYIEKNPAKKLIPKDTRKKSRIRDIFSQDDLTKLFNSPVYQKIDTSCPDYFFIPIIALYSGLRIEEICQLYTEDIRVIDGIPCFDICKGHDKHIKTEAGERIIPLHPVIIKSGFLSYVEGLRKRGVIKLWENLKRKREKYSQDYVKWFSRFKTKYITDSNKKTFHSFRHTLADNLKQKGIDESIRLGILGQAQTTEASGRYGKDYKPALLLETLKGLDYGIDISNLKFPFEGTNAKTKTSSAIKKKGKKTNK